MRLNEMRKTTNVKKINKVMESRFGFKIDYDNLTFKTAVELARGLTEGIDAIKRTQGAHTAEKNPQYMEMYMVREGLHHWLIENETQLITESEMAKSEAILAAKAMVDSIQDMLEKIGKMQNEQMPALLDSIRDQIGQEQADGFKNVVNPLLADLWQALNTGRENADSAARTLAGEQTDQPMDMGGSDLGLDAGADAGLDTGLGSPPMSEPDSDEFAGTDAAAGGEAELGRERR
jgi:hypothetical protein